MLEIVFDMLNYFWKKVSKDLKESVLRPFLKDKNDSEYNLGNYLPISQLNTSFKVYETLIYSRLQEKP